MIMRDLMVASLVTLLNFFYSGFYMSEWLLLAYFQTGILPTIGMYQSFSSFYHIVVISRFIVLLFCPRSSMRSRNCT